MNGHLDVVAPAGDADYQPKLREGTIVGRGTTDMKGGIAVMMEVMKELHSKYPGLGAVFQVTEESEYVKSGADILCERGVFDKTKFVIEGEGSVDPSSGKTHVIAGYEGAYDWSTKITTDESPYHAGRLHLANNAILVGMRYVEHLLNNPDLTVSLDEFKRSFTPWVTPSGKGPINVGKFDGGTQATWTPNYCEVKLEKRLFPGETWKDFAERLKVLSDRFAENSRAKVEVQPLWLTDPFLLDPESEGYKFIRNWARTKNFELSFASGQTDLNKIHNYLKSKKGFTVPGLNFGPGNSSAHTTHEFVFIKDLERMYHLYIDLIKELYEGSGKRLAS
jgi:succinyl-diaminopimelate desuccinylase